MNNASCGGLRMQRLGLDSRSPCRLCTPMPGQAEVLAPHEARVMSYILRLCCVCRLIDLLHPQNDRVKLVTLTGAC